MDDLDFWKDAWDAGIVADRSGRVDVTLDLHWPSLEVAPGSRVLVPLSGTTADLAWLVANGVAPVGVEISPIACRDFFAERGVVPGKVVDGPFVRWRGAGVTILQGDFFDLEDRYDAAVDRGALVAVSPATRTAYVQHLNARLEPNAPILLVVLEFDQTRHSGPPHAIFPDEVQRLFPGAVPLGRGPLQRRRWHRIGGADAVVWAARRPPGQPST